MFRDWSGAVFHESYKDGTKDGEFHGEYELCSRSMGSTRVSVRGRYSGGKKHGYWHNDLSDEGRGKYASHIGYGHYDENGQRQGSWTFRRFHCGDDNILTKWGSRKKGEFVDGKKHGRWIHYTFSANPREGSCYFNTYEQGKYTKHERKKIKTCRQMDW